MQVELSVEEAQVLRVLLAAATGHDANLCPICRPLLEKLQAVEARANVEPKVESLGSNSRARSSTSSWRSERIA